MVEKWDCKGMIDDLVPKSDFTTANPYLFLILKISSLKMLNLLLKLISVGRKFSDENLNWLEALKENLKLIFYPGITGTGGAGKILGNR